MKEIENSIYVCNIHYYSNGSNLVMKIIHLICHPLVTQECLSHFVFRLTNNQLEREKEELVQKCSDYTKKYETTSARPGETCKSKVVLFDNFPLQGGRCALLMCSCMFCDVKQTCTVQE